MGLAAERPAYLGHNLLGTPRPLVPVAAALATDAELEGVVAALVAQAREPLRFVPRSDVAPHARPVDPDGTRRAAKQLAHAPALQLAPQIPQGGIEPSHGPAQVRARELVLGLGNPVHERVDVERVGTERVGCDLTVHHPGGDVGMVRRGLSPAFRPAVRAHPHHADEAVGIGLDALDSHAPCASVSLESSVPRGRIRSVTAATGFNPT